MHTIPLGPIGCSDYDGRVFTLFPGKIDVSIQIDSITHWYRLVPEYPDVVLNLAKGGTYGKNQGGNGQEIAGKESVNHIQLIY